LTQIILLRANSDGADTGMFMWQPSLQAGEPAILAGYPVLEVADAYWPTISANGDPLLLYGDVSEYHIGDRVGFSIQRLDELYSVNDDIGFKVRARFDGKLGDASSFYRLNRT